MGAVPDSQMGLCFDWQTFANRQPSRMYSFLNAKSYGLTRQE